jgi:peptide/nickel transport system permease protein
MRNYTIRRILLFVPTMLFVSVIIFFLLRTLPGDVVAMMFYEAADYDPEILDRIRHELGLDRPIAIQYVEWIWGMLVRGDFGYSFRSQDTVLSQIASKGRITFELAILATIATALFALPIGIASALKHGTWVDQVLRLFTALSMAMPAFYVGIIIIILLVHWFNYFPSIEYVPLWENPVQNLLMLSLPAVAVGLRAMARLARMTRSMMLEVVREDYIRTARAKGLREQTVVMRHALRNAALPVVTMTGAQFVLLLNGTVAVEVVFSLNGLGRQLLDATLARDFIMVQGIVVVMAFAVVLGNLVVDLLYGVLDPRVRYQ